MELGYAFRSTVDRSRGDRVYPRINLTDRDVHWMSNYREPDLAVYLATNPAKNRGSHWVGGPDLAVEIVSPGEDPRAKLDFYAKVQTRELLIVDRDPWKLELYRLETGKLVSVGKSVEASGGILLSDVLPLSFELQEGVTRPTIRITHVATKQVWTA
jgi:Uma2 family endonuclease